MNSLELLSAALNDGLVKVKVFSSRKINLRQILSRSPDVASEVERIETIKICEISKQLWSRLFGGIRDRIDRLPVFVNTEELVSLLKLETQAAAAAVLRRVLCALR